MKYAAIITAGLTAIGATASDSIPVQCAPEWDTARERIRKMTPPVPDWSGIHSVSQRIRSDAKESARIMILFESGDGKRRGYYAQAVTVPPNQWQECELPLREIPGFRSPVGWRTINAVVLHSRGWDAKVPPGARFRIEQFRLNRTPVPAPVSGVGSYYPNGVDPEAVARSERDPLRGEKLAAIDRLRDGYVVHPQWRPANRPLPPVAERRQALDAIWRNFRPDGSFADLEDPAQVLAREKAEQSPNAKPEHLGEARILQAKQRLEFILDSWNDGTLEQTPANKQKVVAALLFYFQAEWARNDFRWIASAFHMPMLAVKSYFTFYRDMVQAEKGAATSELAQLNRLARAVAAECFIYPRGSHFKHPVSVEQFRHSSGWVGGNFTYRPLIDCALVCRNPMMLDTVAEVCRRALSLTSYNTRAEAFWPEGLTADGAGWGHTRQNYLFRYVRDGMRGLVNTCITLKNTPWEQQIPVADFMRVADYIETTLFYSFNPKQYGPTLMAPGRDGMRYRPGGGYMDYNVVNLTWALRNRLLPESAVAERIRLQRCLDIAEGKAPEPAGCRYYFNNDDLIQRRADYFCGVNMTSSRTKSHEVVASDSIGTDLLADGATFLMKRPETYTLARGLWNRTAIPGVTARQGEYRHLPADDTWDGTAGLHPFAGGVTDGELGVCAFLSEKAPYPGNRNPTLYGVFAAKSYFAFDGKLICLGAGVRNRQPELPGTIQTTVDQTEWIAPVAYTDDMESATVQTAKPGKDFRFSAGRILAVHGGVGYCTLADGQWVLSGEKRRAHWAELDIHNRNLPDLPQSGEILQLHNDHTRSVRNGGYAYLVDFRAPEFEPFRQYCRALPFRVLSNTPALQAVENLEDGTVQAVFYQPGTLSFSKGTISTAVPLIVMLRRGKLHVADPLQNAELKRTEIKLTLDGASHTVPLDMPTGIFCGKTITKSIQ